MSVESTEADLLALECSHLGDRDGGYRVASALCEHRNRMPPHAVSEWDEVLVGWVREGPARLWGIALEALAHEGGSDVSEKLATELRSPGRDVEWREYLVHTLIRRGFTSKELTSEVEQAAQQMSPMGLSNLAALLVSVPEVLASAVACLVAAVTLGEYEYVEANIPCFVYAAADSDPQLIVRLVEQVYAQNLELGRDLGEMVIEYLGRPFVRRRFDDGLAVELIQKLRGLPMT